jgi:hypothetical protein
MVNWWHDLRPFNDCCLAHPGASPVSLSTWQLPVRWRPALGQVAWLVVGGDRAHEESRRAWVQQKFVEVVPGGMIDPEVQTIALRELGFNIDGTALGWRAVVRRKVAWQELIRTAEDDSGDDRGVVHILLHSHDRGGHALAIHQGETQTTLDRTGSSDCHLGSPEALAKLGKDLYLGLGGRGIKALLTPQALAEHEARRLRCGLGVDGAQESRARSRL